jgi:hypothetical protein
VHKTCAVDVLILGPLNWLTLFNDGNFQDDAVVNLETLDKCPGEEKRQGWTRAIQTDIVPKGVVDSAIGALFKYGKTFRLYDPHIGALDTQAKADRFEAGLQHLVSLLTQHNQTWKNGFHVELELYTCPLHDVDKDAAEPWQIDESRKGLNRLVMAVERIERKFRRVAIKLFPRSDPNRQFHARFLEGPHAVVNADRGFDFFDDDGKHVRNFLRIQNEVSSHLQGCRDMPKPFWVK